jgi:hypothetical protein
MKAYPSISHERRFDLYVYGFDKLDGSNIRAEWSKKKGFYKFGSRTQLIDANSGVLNEAPDLIRSKYEKDLAEVFLKERYEQAICFFEFHGPSSVAGTHFPEPHDVTLIDVNPYKRGILEPKAFLDFFGHVDHARLVYQGVLTEDIIEQVRAKTIDGITCEGVVFKSKHDKKTQIPIMFKVKTSEWYDRLREFCKGDESLFEKLK